MLPFCGCHDLKVDLRKELDRSKNFAERVTQRSLARADGDNGRGLLYLIVTKHINISLFPGNVRQTSKVFAFSKILGQ